MYVPNIIKRTPKIPQDKFFRNFVNIPGEIAGIILRIHFVFLHFMQHRHTHIPQNHQKTVL